MSSYWARITCRALRDSSGNRTGSFVEPEAEGSASSIFYAADCILYLHF